MPIIHLSTEINAKRKIVFDLSRSIDLHKTSTQHTNETAIDGVTSGLINLNQTVTWRAKHFGLYQKLTTKITELKFPEYFIDEMTRGIFKGFKHVHVFKKINGHTLMIDEFDYESPLGVLGKIADKIIIKDYMTNLLRIRNDTIKEYAESDKWKIILND